MTPPRVAVVGAGIVGASLAYHLARAGAIVTLLDQAAPGSGVTALSFAWINIAHGAPLEQAPLRRLALAEWRRVDDELQGAIAPDWCGALTWSRDPAASARFVAAQAAAGYSVRLVERAEIARLEPALLAPPEAASFALDEGALDPLAATQALVRAGEEHGARVLAGQAVLAVEQSGGRVTGLRTAAGSIPADHVVLAAGVGSTSLCVTLGIALPVAASPAILIRLRTPGRLLQRIVSNPRMELRQAGEGCVLAADDYVGDSGQDSPGAIAQRLLASIRHELRGGDQVALESVNVGQRPMPLDHGPIVGWAPGVAGLYLAAMHAGVILAPVVGRLAANEILHGTEEATLQACRPARFG